MSIIKKNLIPSMEVKSAQMLAEQINRTTEELTRQIKPILREIENTRLKANQIIAPIREFGARLQKDMAPIFEFLEKMGIDARDMEPIFKEAGFWLSFSAMPLSIWGKLKSLKDDGKLDATTLKNVIIQEFRENDYELLKEMVAGWYDIEYFARRKHIFDDALEAHLSGKFTLSIPVIIPHIEGIMGEIIGVPPGYPRDILSLVKKVMAEEDTGFLDVITLNIYLGVFDQLYGSGIDFKNFKEELKKLNVTEGQLLNRHAITHGVQIAYHTEENSLRAMLLLNELYEFAKTPEKVERARKMTEKYNPQVIEKKWQQQWEDNGLNRADIDPSREKYYAMTMYPYPSGDLHMGHWYAMAPSDVRARWMRMKGYNVLFPMGFDSFGLPAENAAIKRGIHPKQWTYANIERMRGQLRSMGAMFDWDREAITSDPSYYKWTQWFFLKLFDMGLAYKTMSPVDFCPTCNTTLAREQVWGEDRHCERCGTPVIKKDLNQWFFKITKYADQLLDYSHLTWPERVHAMQKNWIGRSEGAEVVFKTEKGGYDIPIFTTRPDTLWGATFMVLAPEHPLVAELTTPEQKAAVDTYIAQATRQTEIDRLATDKEKTGVFIGAYAINPVNQERIPIWIADYVLMTYGTGAIMAVPGGDERDFAFAQKYGLPIPVVVAPKDWDGQPLQAAYAEPGTLVNSGPFNGYATIAKYSLEDWTPEVAAQYGLPTDLTPETEGRRAVTRWLEQQGIGKFAVTYRLRDWLISRQRYWGCPIPMITCPSCGIVPVPYDELPVELPEDVQFMPTGESPLKFHEGFRYVKCPQCGAENAERETDTMDTFMCSSWYQYAYMDPHWKDEQPLSPHDIPFNPTEGQYWLPVDQYTGGIEHATMHLLYTRFFTKAMHDMGVVPFDEPMNALFNQGIILGEDREKMSKSRGNVVAPDDLVQAYGADTVRGYLMFGFRWDQGGPWDSKGILGVQRFLERAWDLATGENSRGAGEQGSRGAPTEVQLRELRRKQHQAIRRVTQDIESFSFNTMVAGLMEYTNALVAIRGAAPGIINHPAWAEAIQTLVLLLAPGFPHIAEELWAKLGQPYSVHQQSWPTWDEELAKEDVVEIAVQINGKVRDKIEVSVEIGEDEAKAQALATEGVRRHLEGKTPAKVIYVPGRLVNIVVK